MKILMTGGAGFIGSHLCDLLIKNCHYVICMDNLITCFTLSMFADETKYQPSGPLNIRINYWRQKAQ